MFQRTGSEKATFRDPVSSVISPDNCHISSRIFGFEVIRENEALHLRMPQLELTNGFKSAIFKLTEVEEVANAEDEPKTISVKFRRKFEFCRNYVLTDGFVEGLEISRCCVEYVVRNNSSDFHIWLNG